MEQIQCMERQLFCRLQCAYCMCVLYCWNEAIMTSVFRSISQHQFLFLLLHASYMEVWECACARVSSPQYVFRIIWFKHNSGSWQLGSYFWSFGHQGLISGTWEHGDIDKKKSNGARNTICRMIRKVSKQTTRLATTVRKRKRRQSVVWTVFLCKCIAIGFWSDLPPTLSDFIVAMPLCFPVSAITLDTTVFS